MTVIPPGYADVSVELRHSLMTRPAYITWGCELDAVAADQVAQKTLEALAATAGSLISILDSTTVLQTVTARIGQDGGEPLVFTAESGAAGGKAVVGLPPNCALLVHKRTARGGRRGRGRLFVPFVLATADVTESGVVSTGPRAVLQTSMNVMLAALATKGVPMVVLHSTSEPGTERPTTAGLPNEVTQLSVDPLVSTQRRRLGRN